jgi:hypothetical protein
VTTTSPARLLVLVGTEFRRLEQAQPAVATRLEAEMRHRQDELLQFRQRAGDMS